MIGCLLAILLIGDSVKLLKSREVIINYDNMTLA